MRWQKFLLLAALLTVAVPALTVRAQQNDPDGPYYVVQEGDTLWDISVRLGVSMKDLEQANDLASSDQVSVGKKLLIPGITGYVGEVRPQIIELGDTLESLAAGYQMSEATLVVLNRLTSPASFFAGATVLLPAREQPADQRAVAGLAPGESLLEWAAAEGSNPWLARRTSASREPLPGDALYLGPGSAQLLGLQVALNPLLLTQGKTAEIKVTAPSGMAVTGKLGDKALTFFPFTGGTVALVGIDAMADPGLIELAIQAAPAEDAAASQPLFFDQPLAIQSGHYPTDPELYVDPATLDPTVTEPEEALWKSLRETVTAEKLWDGAFVSPVPSDFKDCWTSLFGNRRSYNNGVYYSYHTGLDFCGRVGTELYAPARGRVVFAGSLKVRGNATVIDHGWGVYTAYDHQSQLLVSVGDRVEPGQRIGLGGDTGRTTGPHLHWEVWVSGVQVDPVDWLKHTYP